MPTFPSAATLGRIFARPARTRRPDPATPSGWSPSKAAPSWPS